MYITCMEWRLLLLTPHSQCITHLIWAQIAVLGCHLLAWFPTRGRITVPITAYLPLADCIWKYCDYKIVIPFCWLPCLGYHRRNLWDKRSAWRRDNPFKPRPYLKNGKWPTLMETAVMNKLPLVLVRIGHFVPLPSFSTIFLFNFANIHFTVLTALRDVWIQCE